MIDRVRLLLFALLALAGMSCLLIPAPEWVGQSAVASSQVAAEKANSVKVNSAKANSAKANSAKPSAQPHSPGTASPPAGSATGSQAPRPQAADTADTIDWNWWIALGLLLTSGGGIALYSINQLATRRHRSAQLSISQASSPQVSSSNLPEVGSNLLASDLTATDLTTTDSTATNTAAASQSPASNVDSAANSLNHANDTAISPTSRLTRLDIVEATIADLQNPDPSKRRKAIWELGQRGDSRAIQPLVNLLVDTDSQQHSLILAALAEISTRTLKPLNRALMLSLQDQSSEVRKNAIRDVTRIYRLMTQVSQLLQYAASDSDEEVQETARWALEQLNHLRSPLESTAPFADPHRLPDAEK